MDEWQLFRLGGEWADALRLENTVGVKGRGLQEQSERHEREAGASSTLAAGFDPDSVFEFFVLFTAISLVPRAVPGML